MFRLLPKARIGHCEYTVKLNFANTSERGVVRLRSTYHRGAFIYKTIADIYRHILYLLVSHVLIDSCCSGRFMAEYFLYRYQMYAFVVNERGGEGTPTIMTTRLLNAGPLPKHCRNMVLQRIGAVESTLLRL